MKTIIVPTDFSGASLNAANYAVDVALATKASIVLLHVCNYAESGQLPITAETITRSMTAAKNQIVQLKENLEHKTGHKITIYTEIREGGLIDQLIECCRDTRPLMVIMGPHGMTAAESFFFGSNTLAAMRNLGWPLIIIPKGTRFAGISNVGIACDLHDIHLTLHAEEIKMLFNEFHPKLHVLHITTKKHGMLDDEEMKGAEKLKEMLKQANPVFHFMQDGNIESAINEFAEKNNLNLLVVIPKTHGQVDSLLHKSQAKQLMLHAHIPVMSIHE